jgi:hypothetical protein
MICTHRSFLNIQSFKFSFNSIHFLNTNDIKKCASVQDIFSRSVQHFFPGRINSFEFEGRAKIGKHGKLFGIFFLFFDICILSYHQLRLGPRKRNINLILSVVIIHSKKRNVSGLLLRNYIFLFQYFFFLIYLLFTQRRSIRGSNPN